MEGADSADVRQDQDHLAITRITLRPIGTPLPLGFIGLALGALAFSALQLRWIPVEQGNAVAVVALGFTVPLQLIACLYGFLARDPIAATGMGVLSGTWAVTGAISLTTPPGTSSPALGVFLLGGALALLVPAGSGTTKMLASAVMGTAALRFALTGMAELTAAAGWRTAAGAVGLLLVALALYAALAFELEDARGRTVLPVLRRGAGRTAMGGAIADQLAEAAHEPGVRRQL